jgi:glycine oxidase
VKHVDYIIVGFGLAGAALALQLRKRGRSVLIFDEPYEQQASRVAAGLFNPVTGKLMQKTWNADELFPYLHDFYKEAEQLTGERFFYPMPICIPFRSIEEQNNWMTTNEEVYTKSRYSDFVDDRFGGLLLRSAGYLDTPKYLEVVRKLFTIEKNFDYDKREEIVIFCEGIHVSSNPYFNWVPIKQLKGETLTVTLDKTPPVIFNRGVYVVPSGGNSWRVGATYSHDTTPGTSESGRKELTEKLDALLRVPYTITNHTWGGRPTTPDRRPIVGPHPEHKNVLIFNGMGTKGVSLAPWSSGMLSDYLEEGRQIKNDVNISRFYALYSKFRD